MIDLDGGIQGISKECISLLRMDIEYIKKKKLKAGDIWPEIWNFINPFKERGSFKKDFNCKYTLPKDSEYYF